MRGSSSGWWGRTSPGCPGRSSRPCFTSGWRGAARSRRARRIHAETPRSSSFAREATVSKLPAHGEGDRMSTLSLEQVELRYVQAGSGPDIVWIPGGDEVAEAWDHQFADFGRSFRNTSFAPD